MIGETRSAPRNGFSARVPRQKLDDWRIKSSPKELKFCSHDHKGLVNTTTEGINESLHGLGGIEEFPSKNEVLEFHEKLCS